MHSLLLPETTPQRTDPLISCQVVYPTCVQASCTHHVPVFLSVDKWRVVLKGENPDYIHAANIKVGIRGHKCWCMEPQRVLSLCIGLQAAESLYHHTGTDAFYCQRLLEDGLQQKV